MPLLWYSASHDTIARQYLHPWIKLGAHIPDVGSVSGYTVVVSISPPERSGGVD